MVIGGFLQLFEACLLVPLPTLLFLISPGTFGCLNFTLPSFRRLTFQRFGKQRQGCQDSAEMILDTPTLTVAPSLLDTEAGPTGELQGQFAARQMVPSRVRLQSMLGVIFFFFVCPDMVLACRPFLKFDLNTLSVDDNGCGRILGWLNHFPACRFSRIKQAAQQCKVTSVNVVGIRV